MKIDAEIEHLRSIGLSTHEIAAYTGLLKTGGAGASELAQEIGVKRTTVYPILENLAGKGLVTAYKKGSKTIFTPLAPNKLVSHYEHKLEALTKMVPILEQMQGTQVKGYGVRFLQTKRELESFYNEILDDYRDKNYCIIGNANAFLNIDAGFLLEFRKKRALRNIHTKLLLSADSKSAIGQGDTSLLREFKYFPEKYQFKSTIDIFDDKILIIGPEVKAMGVVIAIPPMVDVFKSVFEVMWENIK